MVSVVDKLLHIARERLTLPVLGLVDDLHDRSYIGLVQPQLARELRRDRVRKFGFGVEPKMGFMGRGTLGILCLILGIHSEKICRSQ